MPDWPVETRLHRSGSNGETPPEGMPLATDTLTHGPPTKDCRTGACCRRRAAAGAAAASCVPCNIIAVWQGAGEASAQTLRLQPMRLQAAANAQHTALPCLTRLCPSCPSCPSCSSFPNKPCGIFSQTFFQTPSCACLHAPQQQEQQQQLAAADGGPQAPAATSHPSAAAPAAPAPHQHAPGTGAAGAPAAAAAGGGSVPLDRIREDPLTSLIAARASLSRNERFVLKQAGGEGIHGGLAAGAENQELLAEEEGVQQQEEPVDGEWLESVSKGCLRSFCPRFPVRIGTTGSGSPGRVWTRRFWWRRRRRWRLACSRRSP